MLCGLTNLGGGRSAAVDDEVRVTLRYTCASDAKAFAATGFRQVRGWHNARLLHYVWQRCETFGERMIIHVFEPASG